MSAWESTRTPSLRKSASCSIIALRNSSESPILSSSATVHPPSVDWSLLKEPHGGRLRQQPLPFTHLRGHYPFGPILASVYPPDSHVERRSNHFSDSFRRCILGSSGVER